MGGTTTSIRVMTGGSVARTGGENANDAARIKLPTAPISKGIPRRPSRINQTNPRTRKGPFLCPKLGGEMTEEIDPTPQDRESVTIYPNRTQERLDAWKAKWELTR
jgi:hypothetical protein